MDDIVGARMQTTHWIGKVSGDQEHLNEAQDLRATLDAQSSQSARTATCKLVPLNRLITAAS